MASSTWSGRPPPWSPAMHGRRNCLIPRTGSATGSARSAATTTPRPTSAAVRAPDPPFKSEQAGKGGDIRRLPHCFCRGRPVLTNFFRSFRALPFAILLIVATVLPVLAGPFEDAVAKFANDEYSDTAEAVDALATSANPLAYAIVSALQDGRLMADPDTKKIYLTQPDGKIIDAATGATVASMPDSAAAVRLNNKLRRHVEAALGALTLQSPDPAKRVQAAQSVFKTHDEATLPTIDAELA